MSSAPIDDRGDESFWERVAAKSWTTVAIIVVVGTANGLFAGWTALTVEAALYNLDVTVWLFLIVWSGTTAYLFTERAPSGVVGTGLYVMALFVVLKPVVLFGSALATGAETTGTAATVRSFEGATAWAAVAVVLALLTAAVGNYFKRRARRSALRRAREQLHEHRRDD